MMLRKHLTVAPLLILVLSVFRGHTLTCNPTEYLNGDQCCPRCPAGSRVRNHCTEFRTTSCLDCDEGTFMNHPTGFTECFPCYRCDSDFGLKLKTPCTTTSDTVCEPLEGFYCLFFIKDDCVEAQKHSSCQPGQYILQKGTALRDTECSDCSNGTFSDGTLLTSCQPHTQCQSLDLQLIKPGTASTDAQCKEQSSGAGSGAIVGGLVTLCLVVGLPIALFFMWRLKKKKDTEGERNADTPQQCMDLLHTHTQRQFLGHCRGKFHVQCNPVGCWHIGNCTEIKLNFGIFNSCWSAACITIFQRCYWTETSQSGITAWSKSRTKYVTAPGSSLRTSAPSLSPGHFAACTVSSPCVELLKGQHVPIPVIPSHRSPRHHVSEGRYHQRANTWPPCPRGLLPLLKPLLTKLLSGRLCSTLAPLPTRHFFSKMDFLGNILIFRSLLKPGRGIQSIGPSLNFVLQTVASSGHRGCQAVMVVWQ